MMRDFPIVRILVCGAGMCLVSLNLYWSLRFCLADHYFRGSSLQELRRSNELAPANSSYLLRLARFQAYANQDATATLLRAAQAAPLNSAAWIDLGLAAQEKHDNQTAEQYLLRAAAVDHEFAPRWNLLVFYLLQGNRPEFWRWTKSALAIGGGDLAAVFRLCWESSQDADEIFREAIPKRHAALHQYLTFLILTGRMNAAPSVARELMDVVEKQDLPILLSYCERQMVSGHAEQAMEIWNSLSRHKLIEGEPSNPGKTLLTNGDFHYVLLNRGFDWHFNPVEGVSLRQDTNSSSLRMEFAGRQPEACEILSQYVMLPRGGTYRLSYAWELNGIDPRAGLQWLLFSAGEGPQVPLPLARPSIPGKSGGELLFIAPPQVRTGRLVFIYQRAPGTVRIEGSARLSRVSLESVNE